MLEVIDSDYVRTARAKGVDERRVTMKHAFRNALIPLVTLVALNFGAILGGAIVDRDRLLPRRDGALLRQRLLTNDPYPVMAWLMVTAVMIIIFNLIADIRTAISTHASAMSEPPLQPTCGSHSTGGSARIRSAAVAAANELAAESGVEVKARSQWAYVRIRFLRHRLAVASLVSLS